VAPHLARALARLHAVDPEQVKHTPVPPMASRAEILARIDEQETKLRVAASSFTSRPRPLDALLFAWLRQLARDHDVRPALLHGDPGFHNLLVHEGRVSALLDWERSLVGDPAQDLAYVRPQVERVVPWRVFLDAYCAAGGSAPSDDRLHYYAVWHDTWRYVGSFRGLSRLHGDRASVLDAVTGLLHAPRFLLSALRTAFEVDL
jgi:aminoglycoside phosphotransferase (APT) family kinase protein